MTESLSVFLNGLRAVLRKLGEEPPPQTAPRPRSPDLVAFEKGIGELAAAFLPSEAVQPPAEYSTEALMLARAFIVFAHAQLEEYLEAVARQRANLALARAIEGKVDGVVAALLAFHGNKPGLPTARAKYKSRSVELASAFPNFHRDVDRLVLAQLKAAVDEYNNLVERNHGVKEVNLVKMFAPLGISPLEMETTWVAAMDDFGTLRGGHAHSGLSAVSKVIDPFDANRKLHDLLEGPPGASSGVGAQFKIYSLRSLDALLQGT